MGLPAGCIDGSSNGPIRDFIKRYIDPKQPITTENLPLIFQLTLYSALLCPVQHPIRPQHHCGVPPLRLHQYVIPLKHHDGSLLTNTLNITLGSLESYNTFDKHLHYFLPATLSPLPVQHHNPSTSPTLNITLGSLESRHILITPFTYSFSTTPPTRTTKLHNPPNTTLGYLSTDAGAGTHRPSALGISRYIKAEAEDISSSINAHC